LLNNEDAVFLSKALPFWKGLSEQEKDTIIKNTVSLSYEQGSSIANGNGECSGLLIVKEGVIRAFITSPEGRQITLYRLLSYDICIMSASCIIKNIDFVVNLEIEKQSRILVLPTAIFNNLNNTNIAVKEYAMQLVSSRFSDVMWVMEQVVFGSLPQRIAAFLMEQGDINGTDTLKITHETIANNIGTAREVVSRMLKYFENEGAVKINRGEIKLLSYKKLKQLAR